MIIKNFWQQVSLFCGCHNKPVEMIPNTKGSTLFYSCPKYYEENREKGEHACANRIKLDDYQSAVEHLSTIIAQNEMDGNVENLTGYRWNDKGIEFEVIKHEPNKKLQISMINRPAMK